MYKNTFDQTIQELQERNLEVIEILRIIALYEEPVDIFSISKIADVKIKNVEAVCVYLSTKLILSKMKIYSLCLNLQQNLFSLIFYLMRWKNVS